MMLSQPAGGLTEDANGQGINLKALRRWSKIYILKGEEPPPEIPQPEQNKATSNKQTNTKRDKKTVVDINRATVEEFNQAQGVGEGLVS